MSNPNCSKHKENLPVKIDINPTQTQLSGHIEESKESQDHNAEESGEDIPGDFFDDFLKEDFMAGLDIVDDDEWGEDNIKAKAAESCQTAIITQAKEGTKRRRKKKVNSVDDGSIAEKERHNRQKKKKHEEKDNSRIPRNIEKKIDADEFDIRRDPEKTKRDIAKDKVRCEKDKEMKIISEKLSLVETGLVPPGMEMEIDIEEIKRQKEKIENKSPRDLREHLKDLKGRNKTPAYKLKSSPRKRSLTQRSPGSAKRASPIQRRSRSPRRDPLVLGRSALSPIRRSQKGISPRRSPLKKTPITLSQLRHRSSERVYIRRRSPSPYYRSRRDKYSPHRRRNRSSSRESDREKWLKRRNHSRSPRRKRDEKKSFLQEIAEKLNEIRQPINVVPASLQSMQAVQPLLPSMQPTLHYIQSQPLPTPAPVPAPVPVPPPNSIPIINDLQQPPYDPYDQSFFIGSIPAPSNNFPCHPQLSPVPVNLELPSNSISTQYGKISQITSNCAMPKTSTVNPQNVSEILFRKEPENKEDVAKLFQDKQITLSEFLAITAKPEVFRSSPKELQEKIKVISRCHEAIKILGNCEKKYSGRLIVHKTDKYQSLDHGRLISPLKLARAVQFPFTSREVSAEEQKNSFTLFINDLLQKLGLLNNTVVNVDDEELPDTLVAVKEDMVKSCSPPHPSLLTSLLNSQPQMNKVRHSTFFDSNRFSKMVQTDIFKCENCEKRKKILYRTTAIQADTSVITFSVSTQVTEEELQPKAPKTKSLAAMTPAQLLAKSRESLSAVARGRLDKDDFDIHPAGYSGRPFFRGSDGYGASRPLLPFSSISSSMYDDLNSQILGGGRGRELNVPRTLEFDRFNHNNYY